MRTRRYPPQQTANEGLRCAFLAKHPRAEGQSFEDWYASLFVPGERVRCTGTFLARTGQRAGGEGEKVWTLVACDCGCADSRLEPYGVVAVDERSAADPARWRHFARGNLMVVGAPPRASDFP